MLCAMKKPTGRGAEAQPINPDEFMTLVVCAAPSIMREVGGIVNVDVTISIDETGRIESFDRIRCSTLTGRLVKPDEPEIVEAAKTAVRLLRFRRATHNGVAVRQQGFQLSFGFTTAALDYLGERRSAVNPRN